MALSYTAPGVYIQELPPGSRTLVGVATSLTAFVGTAPRGPVNKPTFIFSMSDYDRQFGGLFPSSTMSQCVRHYFQNGGQQALIVRVVNNGPDSVSTAKALSAGAELSVGTTRMVLRATPAAVALVGFDHLGLIVSSVSGTGFNLRVEARDANDVVLTDGTAAASAYSYLVSLNAGSAGSMATALNAATTSPAVPAIKLVELVGDQMSAAPAAGTSRTAAVAGIHSAALFSPAAAAKLVLKAANPGNWGENLRATVSVLDTTSPSAFHLTLSELGPDGRPVAEEVFLNVTLGAGDPRALDRILERESALARVEGNMPVGSAQAVSSQAFASGADGTAPRIVEDFTGTRAAKTGIYSLLAADIFNLLCIPLDSWSAANSAELDLWTQAAVLCGERRAMLLVDPPSEWTGAPEVNTVIAAAKTFGPRSDNAALYYPQVSAPDPLQEGRLRNFPPCGVVAGVVARTDSSRGVWKAPAGVDATLRGVPELSVKLQDEQHGQLNQLGINCLRTFPVYGSVVWGARTLNGADVQASQWKHIPVRRTALYIEESLFRGTLWAVFEPNDEPLWASLRVSIRSFMHGLFRQGAFQGSSPRDAYLVKCDSETTTQADIDRGIVNVLVGFAPLKPAEFVILKIQQLAGQNE